MKNNLIFYAVIIFISLFIIFFMGYLNQNCFLFGDDYFFGTYYGGEKIFDCLFKDFLQVHGGGYLCLFLSKFFNFGLPVFLGIHPNDFAAIPVGILKGIILTALLLYLSKFSTFYCKSKIIFCITFLCLCVYHFYFAAATYSHHIFSNNLFFRYILPLLFYTVFIYGIFKNLLTDYKDKKNNFAVLIICAILLGMGLENIIFSLYLLIVLILIYNFIVGKFFDKCNKYNIDKSFYILSLCFFISSLIYINSFGFKVVAQERGLANIQINFQIIKEFSGMFFKYFIINEIFYWILFIILFSVCLFLAKKNHEIKKIILPVFLNISYLMVMFSMILCGKTYPISGENLSNPSYTFWIERTDLIFSNKILILIPLLLYVSYILLNVCKYNDITRKAKIISLSLILVSCSFYIYKIANSNEYKTFLRYYKTAKSQRYIQEKLIRFYETKQMQPIIKAPIMDYTYKVVCTKNLQTNKKEKQRVEVPSVYFQKIYKDNKYGGYNIKEDAIYIFYENGGGISRQELDNIKFKRLFNLNNYEDDIIPPDKINNLFKKILY